MGKIIIIMGVSGSGKTTIGQSLADQLNLPFYDADTFHPPANIEKMSTGNPLDDSDREPWLKSLGQHIINWQQDKGAVLACSALKESYRKLLMSNGADINWVYLKGNFDLILQRMLLRPGHFMAPEMLQSQFNTLEPPAYGIHIDIADQVEQIIKSIIKQMESNTTPSDIGLIGLGVMGSALSLNFADQNIQLSVFNRSAPGEEHILPDFMSANKNYNNINGFSELEPFVDSLAMPRKILLMIKAGPAIDAVVEQLVPLLAAGDIIIDGGNSHYQDTERRSEALLNRGIHFVGSGVSGGEAGARRGPSVMPGGTAQSYQFIGPLLEAIAAKDEEGRPCCAHIGPGGSGHFVKMVHNGIEYAEMQLLAEMYALLSTAFTPPEIADIFSEWNQTELQSYLLDITIKILTVKENDHYLIDLILDQAGNKGTGSWSSKAALELGYPNNMMSAAVFARYMSAFKKQREAWAQKLESTKYKHTVINTEALRKAYRAAQIINHHQGFELMHQASQQYHWNLDLSMIARIWTNGCIIRSAFMKNCIGFFKNKNQLLNIPAVFKQAATCEESLRQSIQKAMNLRIATPCFSNAYQYWISMSSERLPANLIQAQRDFFGAHTYQRVDQAEDLSFHTEWV